MMRTWRGAKRIYVDTVWAKAKRASGCDEASGCTGGQERGLRLRPDGRGLRLRPDGRDEAGCGRMDEASGCGRMEVYGPAGVPTAVGRG